MSAPSVTEQRDAVGHGRMQRDAPAHTRTWQDIRCAADAAVGSPGCWRGWEITRAEAAATFPVQSPAVQVNAWRMCRGTGHARV